MPRLKGNTNVRLLLATEDVSLDLKAWDFTEGEGEQETFADYASGVAPTALALTFALSFDTGSAFHVLWDNAGASNIEYELVPDDDKPVGANNPRFYGTCTLPFRPRIGMEASNEGGEFEVEIQLDSYDFAETEAV